MPDDPVTNVNNLSWLSTYTTFDASTTISPTSEFNTYSGFIETMAEKEPKIPAKFRRGDKVRMIKEVDGWLCDGCGEIYIVKSRRESSQRYDVLFKFDQKRPYVDETGAIQVKIVSTERSWTCPEDSLAAWVYSDGLENWE